MAAAKKPTIRWDAQGKYLHIEAPGCIVNVYVGLHQDGNEATRVEIACDGDRFSGELWKLFPGVGEHAISALMVKAK